MRLIDADALDSVLEEFERRYKKSFFKISAKTIKFVRTIVFAMKTADEAKVVRCEKCIYRSQYADKNGNYKCGGILTEDEESLLMVKPDFFCAYGERRAAKMDLPNATEQTVDALNRMGEKAHGG